MYLFAWSGGVEGWVGHGNLSAAGLTVYLLEESGIARCCRGREGERVEVRHGSPILSAGESKNRELKWW